MSELERGRYRLTEVPEDGLIQLPSGSTIQVRTGELLLARAVGTCDTCQHCGCGTTAEPVVIPAVVGKVLTGKQVEMHEIMGLAATLPQALKGLKRGRTDSAEGSGEREAPSQGRRAARRARNRAGGVGLPDQTGNSAADPDSAGLAAGSTQAGR